MLSMRCSQVCNSIIAIVLFTLALAFNSAAAVAAAEADGSNERLRTELSDVDLRAVEVALERFKRTKASWPELRISVSETPTTLKVRIWNPRNVQHIHFVEVDKAGKPTGAVLSGPTHYYHLYEVTLEKQSLAFVSEAFQRD